MADVLAIAMLVAFFGLTIAFVRACELIIGPDLEAEVPETDTSVAEPERAAA